VQFILDLAHLSSLSLITHSWGSMPARLFATVHPTLINQAVMFALLR
jgi:hypothetical protein